MTRDAACHPLASRTCEELGYEPPVDTAPHADERRREMEVPSSPKPPPRPYPVALAPPSRPCMQAALCLRDRCQQRVKPHGSGAGEDGTARNGIRD